MAVLISRKGFVEFQTKEEAELAVETNKNLVIENHKLESFLVNYAPVSNTEQKKDYQIGLLLKIYYYLFITKYTWMMMYGIQFFYCYI